MLEMKPRTLIGVVKESETKRQAHALIASNTELETVMTFLRERGLNKIDSINFLVRHMSMPLRDAKESVDNSDTWSNVTFRDNAFHQNLVEAAKRAGFVFVLASSSDDTEGGDISIRSSTD
jgi:ribosomal protein L7/L12